MATQCYVLLLLVTLCSSSVAGTPCEVVMWDDVFHREGLSGCNVSRHALNGFARLSSVLALNLQEYDSGKHSATCCEWDPVYKRSATVVLQTDWKHLLERSNQWVRCPPGFFLEGLNRKRGGQYLFEKIEGGHCVKPASHPYHYKECYDKDITNTFDPLNAYGGCDDNFFLTGFFRGSCEDPYCLNMLRCCRMSTEQIQMESLETVKIRIMEDTLVDISQLAHYLGYGNAGGCRSGIVGQDFLRNEDTWEAVEGEKCAVNKTNRGFSIEYKDWKIGIKDMNYSDPLTEVLNPEVIDSATIYNNDTVNSSHTIRRTETSHTTVSHTKTSSWSTSHQAGASLTVGVSAGFFSASASASYTFTYANDQSTSDSQSNEQEKKFEVESSKSIPPNSAVKWLLVLGKTRTTISYTAVISVQFSVQLRGFLRGGSYYDATTNFNYDHRGRGVSDHSYTFGGSSQPFYTALKKESERNSKPWMWNAMQANYNYRPEEIINELVNFNEDRYAFVLTGRFEGVSGQDVKITWQDVTTEQEQTGTSGGLFSNLLGKRKKRDVGRSRRKSVWGNDAENFDESKVDDGTWPAGDSNRGSTISRNTRNDKVIIYPDEKVLVHAAKDLQGDPPATYPLPPPVNIRRRPNKEREPIPVLG